MPQEIERKFLVESIPDGILDEEFHLIEQGYLAISEDGSEVRIRRLDDRYFQTIKSGGGLQRQETEVEISKEIFETLWPLTRGKRIQKFRYLVDHSDHTIEVDVYRGSHEGLIIAEVEFSNVEESEKFKPPGWMNEEVTGNREYKNQYLATNGG